MTLSVGKEEVTTTTNSKANELTLESMVLSLKKLEVEMKIEDIKKNNGKVIAYFPKRFRRPKWIIDLLKQNNIPSQRSSFVEDRKFYLLDTDQFHFWDKKGFVYD